MKIVWLSHFIPYPPRGGSYQRTFNLLRGASKGHEIYLIALNIESQNAESVSECKQQLKKYCAEVEVWETPYKWKGPRWWAQLAVSPVYHHHHAARSLWSPRMDARWKEVLEAHSDALICVETIDLARYFAPLDTLRKVLNHQNCESAMAERRAENEANPIKRAYLSNQARKIARLEREWCPKFNVNIAVSELDAQIISSHAPDAHVHVVENGTDTDYFVPMELEQEPKSIIFAASLRWYPNISAIRFLKQEIWPLLRQKRPGIHLYLTGRSPVDEVKAWARDDSAITLVADPEDVRPWVAKAAVFVCPIIDGGGTRLKILDAMAMGKPVVSTSIGCEGLRVKHGENILISDSPQDFANCVLHLLEDGDLRRKLSNNGRALVEQLYSWDVIGGHLDDALTCATVPKRQTGIEPGCRGGQASIHPGKK